MDIYERARIELVENERGRDEFRTKENRRQSDSETTYYCIRRANDTAMYREHLVRTIRELRPEGEEEIVSISAERIGHLG